MGLSYLLIPLIYLLFRKKLGGIVPAILALYGVIFFLLTFGYDYVSKDFTKYYQAIYTFLEYMVFAAIYWNNIESTKFKKTIASLSVLFILFQLIYTSLARHSRLDSVPIGVETILILIFIAYFFYEFSLKVRDFYIYNHYCFWISIGSLVYLGGSFFFYILINNLSEEQVNTFGNLIYLSEIIKNIIFSLSLFFYARYYFTRLKDKSATVPYLDMI